MLDVSQYTAARKKRELDIIEFWRPDATDSIRRPGLIYKELEHGKVVTKSPKVPAPRSEMQVEKATDQGQGRLF
jgi:hypothetical protein